MLISGIDQYNQVLRYQLAPSQINTKSVKSSSFHFIDPLIFGCEISRYMKRVAVKTVNLPKIQLVIAF